MKIFTDIDQHYARQMGLGLDNGSPQVGQICLANESRFNESYFNQPVTAYAVGGWDKVDVAADLDFFAPAVEVPRRFTYGMWTNAEQFLSDDDDERAIGSDFKRVEFTSTKVEGKTINRGLMLRVDLDEVADKSNWENAYASLLMQRLKRNSLRRSITLLAAAAVNQARTWDTTAGKDPDQDVRASLLLANNVSGLRPNRVGYGDTAWDKRNLAHRAQNSAGGFASSALSPEQLASQLMVDKVHVSRARYQNAAATKAEILNNLVLSFYALDGALPEDPSNIKRFVTPTVSGPVRVYTQQVSAKLFDLTVEHYELIKITYTGGIRKDTIS
jgi:hypothetical protein